MIKLELSTGVLIVISIILFILIVACIAFIIYKDKKGDQKEIDDLIDDLVKAKPRNNDLINAKIEVPIGEKKPIKEQEDSKVDLEEMLNKMQETLNSKKEDVVANFEEEQEEKAIISYQELLGNMKNDSFKNEIEIHELEQEKTEYQESKEKVKEFLTREEPKIKKIESPREEKDKKFKNTDFISPIFGKMNAKIEYPKVKLFDKEKTEVEEYFEDDFKHAKVENEIINDNTIIEDAISIKPIQNEIKKNDDFLKALKEFRSNL